LALLLVYYYIFGPMHHHHHRPMRGGRVERGMKIIAPTHPRRYSERGARSRLVTRWFVALQTGSVPPEIGLLTQLQVLWLHNTQAPAYIIRQPGRQRTGWLVPPLRHLHKKKFLDDYCSCFVRQGKARQGYMLVLCITYLCPKKHHSSQVSPPLFK
jgi:hypothetical protein